MIRKFVFRSVLLTSVLAMSAILTQAASLSATLQKTLATATNNASVGVVIVSFNTNKGLDLTHLALLRSVGITKGLQLKTLGMVVMVATPGQGGALPPKPQVTSGWSKNQLYYFMNQARMLAGVDRLRQDSEFTTANGG